MTNTEPTDNFPSSRFSKAQRQYAYGVATAVVPLAAVSLPFVAGNAQLILGGIAAVLGFGAGALALSNTTELPKK